MYLALDTEFVWQRTYYAKLGLIQAAMSPDFDASRIPSDAETIISFREKDECRKSVRLIDPLTCDPEIVGRLIEDPSVTKILHDALQDLQHIRKWSHSLPRNVFDTRLAAGFCGMPATLSLRNLLKETLGIELAKSETRTDWMRRPLSPEQLEYAADDVAYLGRVMDILTEKAKEFGTYSWLIEEMALFDQPELYREDEPENAWRRIRINPEHIKNNRQFMRLRELAAWREATARRRDLPRSWVVEDKVMISAALNPPKSQSDISRKDLPQAFTEGFFKALELAETMPESGIPELRAFPAASTREATAEAMAFLVKRAESLHIDPSILGSRSDLIRWAGDPGNPDIPLNKGWRYEAVGKDLRNMRLF